MSAEIRIRGAAPADIESISRIYAQAVRHGTASFELDPPTVDEMMRRYLALREGGFPYLVAERAGAIAGYAYAGPHRARPAYRWTVEDSIYVAADFQRRGVGRALLERLIADSEALRFRQMIAVIGNSAQTPSIALHQALGFRKIGILASVGFKFGRWLDSVLLQRALGEGDGAPP